MKRTLSLLIFIATILVGCESKWPKNGDLDGMWQVMEIERNGTASNTKDQQLYMSIQLDLFQLGTKVKDRQYYGYFRRNGNKIAFWKFAYDSKNETASDNNVWITEADIDCIKPWGFYTLFEEYDIIKLNESAMILQSDSAKVTYRKF